MVASRTVCAFGVRGLLSFDMVQSPQGQGFSDHNNYRGNEGLVWSLGYGSMRVLYGPLWHGVVRLWQS